MTIDICNQKPDTSRLRDDSSNGANGARWDEDYLPFPDRAPCSPTQPVWHVRFELLTDPPVSVALAINGDVILGRESQPPVFNLASFKAEDFGVSRRHLKLRPTTHALYAIDMASTNGTLRNEQSIGINTPYPLRDGDRLTLGHLQTIVRIVRRPTGGTAILRQKADLADAMSEIARAITSQLEPREVLNRVAEMAMAFTEACETGIWLVDDQSGELFLEAQRGLDDEQARHLRIPIRGASLAGQVIRTGRPLCTRREPGEEPIKINTDYLVESVIHVPITLGGVTFGVLMGASRTAGHSFGERDERLLTAVADFAAIAIQNARLHQSTDQALSRRVQELSALNELSHTVSASLDLQRVYDVLREQVREFWPGRSMRLWLRSGGTGLLELFSPGAVNGAGGMHLIPPGKGLIGRSAQRNEVLCTDDLQGHPDYEPTFDEALLPAKHLMAVPLRVGPRLVGVLALFGAESSETFSSEDARRLESFAQPVSIAIKNARLFAESEQARAAIYATAYALPQPMLIVSDRGEVLVSNDAAKELLAESMADVFEGISRSVGRTTECLIGDRTYLATVEHTEGVGTIVVMQDITYVKQLEHDRAEFVRALSHDLKGPMTSIKGFAELAGLAGDLPPRSADYIEKIGIATNRLIEMTGDLLNTLAISDAAPLRREPLDVDDIARQVIYDLEGAALSKSIAVTLQASEEPFQIYGDPSRLYHAVLNLVENAIKYAEAGPVEIALDYGPEHVVVTVADRGPGIPDDELTRVFDQYFRGSRNAGQAGSGLGLSVVAATVRAHGGEVAARNREGGGAVFEMRLPALRAECACLTPNEVEAD